MKLDIQLFADGKVTIDTDLNTKNFENGLNRMQSATQKAGSTIKNIVVGLGITKLISSAMNQITQSIDGAISRYDTLNNFPKVMSNLGIASEEADASIKKMSERLAGLPTTLDEGARAVQRFTSANGDVEKSTDLFLALNNAILAGGAGTEIQANALEQLSQAYAKGKPDMMEWRTAMTAMPAQLKQVAKAMGYVSADELGQDLREGAVSMDEFMDTIVRLNEEGLEGFQNFEQQARNATGGIKTAITVAKTQVVKGVADIIQALNTRMEDTGLGTLSEFIGNVGKKSKVALDELAKLISGELSLFDFGQEIADMINNMIVKFNEHFPEIFNTGVDLLLEFARGLANEENINELITNTSNMIQTIIDTITNRLPDVLVAGAEVITNLITGIANELPNLIEKLSEVNDKMLETITSDEFMDKLFQAGGKILVALAVGIVKATPHVIQGIGQLKARMQEEVMHLPETFMRIGADIIIGLWEGVKSQIGGFSKKFEGSMDDLVSKIKKKLQIASPSKVFRDEIGAMMGEGLAIGFEDSIKNAYRDMQHAIDVEQGKLLANVETGKVFNTLQNATPITININSDVEMDGQKVGRIVTPVVTRTIKNGGGL